ncbi:T9SS type A sorting domain-containing protein [Flavobacterium terrisoli]|uniref:T9SS type A sorting domain-containing protein n=1 Tax=Flavobacterium terrisoli TaxID=3242195 RepID=UPI002542D843|nr:T9SS type A sorting domain-containing protein [Flavobacterium buctense]
MKRKLSLLLSVCGLSYVFSQSPGGVSQAEIWSKVIKDPSPATTFRYKDHSRNNKAITLGAGTTLQQSLLNYNYSYTYNSNSFVSFLSKVESMKDATVFMVSQPLPPSNPSDLQALMSTAWNSSVPVASGAVNEQAFRLSTATFDKNNLNLPYPTASGSRPNARLNTLVWHNFNSKKIVNSYGVNGESDVLVGKAFNGAINFQGEIPEFIVYRKALNQKEKWRVESYLAIKYGITLEAGVNYYNSKNEIVWHKENNPLFGNRIFGLGKDSNSALNQKQAVSAHDANPLKKMIFWTGDSGLLDDNYANTAYIEDQSFLLMGDNNGAETPNTVLNNGIKKINRVWLTEKFGPSTHNLVTHLKYKKDPSVTLLPDEAFWLLIDRNAGNNVVSDFNGGNVDAYQVTSFTGGYAEYNDLKWSSPTTTYNQFTFGVGPKMVVFATVQPMACNGTIGTVDFVIRGGQPIFAVNIHGTDNAYNQQFFQPERDFSFGLTVGSYAVTVTDASGYTQTTNFTVTPIPGMLLELGPTQMLALGDSATLNAAANITVPNVSYAWYFTPVGQLPNNIVISTDPSIVVTDGGNYTCKVLNNSTGCFVEDSVTIIYDAELRPSFSQVYPNPTSGHFTVNVDFNEIKDVSIIIYDVTGKTLINEYFNGEDHYQKDYDLTTSGIYFVAISAKDYVTTHKLIIN